MFQAGRCLKKPRKSGAHIHNLWEDKTMAICPVKRFAPELIRIYAGKMLKKIVCSTLEEIHLLENSPELPACLRLFIGTLICGMESGRFDTLYAIFDFIDSKTLGEQLCRHLL
jgi:hypothetical protein